MAKHSSASVSPAEASTPKRARASMRHQMQLSFQSESSRDSFLASVDRVKKRLFPGRAVDNGLLCSTDWKLLVHWWIKHNIPGL